jgi:subtilisin family serine protease
MSEYYEFTVCLKDPIEKDNFIQQMASDVKILNSSIPARTCEHHDIGIESNRYIKYYLTQEEVSELEKDPRIQSIHQTIPGAKQRLLDFNRKTNPKLFDLLVTDTSIQNNYAGDEFAIIDLPISSGVDIVISDSWINPNHGEFTETSPPNYNIADDAHIAQYADNSGDPISPNSRVFALRNASNTSTYWTSDSLLSDHGNHVAGTAAGKTQGWCRHARIINIDFQKFAKSPGNQDALLEWHNFKKSNNINRSTIVNNSWGYAYPDLPVSYISSIKYRGVTYEYSDFPMFPVFDTDMGYLDKIRKVYNEYLSYFLNKGLCFYEVETTANDCILAPLPIVDAVTDATIENHIDAGMIYVVAAGNDSWAIVNPDSPDWDNTVYFTLDGPFSPGSSQTQYQVKYNQGGSPNRITRTVYNSPIIVGALRSKNYKTHFSCCGSAITVYAPGEDIMSSVKGAEDFFNLINDMAVKDGTSMASPQVAGVVGLVAQKQLLNNSPWPMNNADAQASGVQYLIDSSYSNMYDSAINSGVIVVPGKPEIYDTIFAGNTQSSMGLKDSPNRCLFFDANIIRCGQTLDKPPCLWGECDGSGSGSGSGSSSILSSSDNDNLNASVEKQINDLIEEINQQTNKPETYEKWWWLS